MKHKIEVAALMGIKPSIVIGHMIDDDEIESITVPVCPTVSVAAIQELARMLARFDYDTADHVGEPEDPEGVA